MAKNNRNFRFWSTGSFTVEAAFVVPILLGIVFAVLYLLFLFHDRIVLQEKGYEALYSMAEGSLPVENRTMKERTENALWIVQIKKTKVSKKHKMITGKIEAEVQWDIPVMNFFLEKVQKIDWSQTISCVHPEEVKIWKIL